MSTRTLFRAVTVAAVGSWLSLSSPATVLHAQPGGKRLFDDTSDTRPSRRNVPHHRQRTTTAHLDVLKGDDVEVNLFDDVQLTVHKTKSEKYGTDQYVWRGRNSDGDAAMFAMVRGFMSGTVYSNGRSFEIAPDSTGHTVINELDGSAFPTDDPVGQDLAPAIPAGQDVAADTTGTSSGTTAGSTAAGTTIDALIVWTPAARNAVGGSASAIQSLVLAAVANANQAYANSGVSAQIRLVYSGEVAFTETPSNISGDLTALSTNGDGKIDVVHSLRAQYGADIVTLIGNGYAGAGSCGIGYIMSTVSTSFAPYAFTVVDQSCAAGYLSYAHEVGHNEGLQHDPANAGSAPSYTYAYGYQDPAGQFRTVLSYGGETRIPYFSSPLVSYLTRPTGTSTQDNARALRNNVATVANFVGSVAGGTTAQAVPCTYALSTTSMTFSSAAAASSDSVTTASGCSWTATSSTSWITVSGGANGSGAATISVSSNTGSARTGTVVVAGQTVTVTQGAPVPCTFTVSPTSLAFTAASSAANVSVTTGTTCAWTTQSGASWITVGAGRTGSGTIKVSVGANAGAARTGTVTAAGKTITVSQGAATTTTRKGNGKP